MPTSTSAHSRGHSGRVGHRRLGVAVVEEPGQGTNHRVDCWAFNLNNNLGSGVPAGFVFAPVHVNAVGGAGRLDGVRSLTTDGASFCGLMTDATVDCWGDNGDGSLGQGHVAPHTSPVVVKAVGAKGVLRSVTQVGGSEVRKVGIVA